MSENIYDILSKLNGAMGKTPTSTVEVDPIVESIDPDDLSNAVSLLEKKFSKFNPGDEAEGNWLNPKAKRTVQLAKAKYPETASDLEAVVAAMGDKTEELDQRDRETGEWMDKAKATIDAQQKEIKRTEQAIVDANARYDAQEKRFQDFTQQVAAADLPVQQQAQAAVDFAKATKDTGAAPEKIAARGKEIVSKAKEKAKAKEQPSIQNQPAPVQSVEPSAAPAVKKSKTKSAALNNQPEPSVGTGLKIASPGLNPNYPVDTTADAANTDPLSQYLGRTITKKVANMKETQLEEMDTGVSSNTGIQNAQKIANFLSAHQKYREALENPQPGYTPQQPPVSVVLQFISPDGRQNVINLSKSTVDKLINSLKRPGTTNQERSDFTNIILADADKLRDYMNNLNSPRPVRKVVPVNKGQDIPDMDQDKFSGNKKLPQGSRDETLEGKEFLGIKSMKTLDKLQESLMEKFMAFKEEAKPDFLDLDKDSDTEEPMKKAAKDAKEHEPAKPDSDAVAKRKRLQALKDKQEDERAEKDDYDTKSSSRVVKGRAYGGAAQKDDEDKDLDESGLQAYLGKKKYGKEGMKALQKAGREGASKETMAKLRAQHDKFDESQMDEVSYSAKAARAGKDIGKPGKAFAKIAKSAGERYGSKERGEKVAGAVLKKLRANEGEGCMDEVAPPGAKAERMVKHIKKGYAKDGKLTGKEKAIAYATTWAAHKKGQVEEATEFGDTIKNSKAE